MMRWPLRSFALLAALVLASSLVAAAPGYASDTSRTPASLAAGRGAASSGPYAASIAGASAFAPASPPAIKMTSAPGTYIVVLTGEPLAGYGGDIDGLTATNPAVTGEDRLSTDSAASQDYLDYLTATQDTFVTRATRAIGRAPETVFRYTYATNGVALRLTPDEAQRIATLPGVVSIEASRLDRLTTDFGPRFVGAGGIWDGSAIGATGNYGEGVVVGVIDTGITMAHKSFAAVDEDGYEHANPRGHFFGMCDPKHATYNASYKCNDKLIGVYSFLTVPSNNMDPEDDNGHGTHTASTAAGNVLSLPYGAPTIDLTARYSGVAPHANIIAYDTCYSTPNGLGSCPSEATLAALDQAVADGVDVVNYSIETGQDNPWTNTHYRAWRRLRDAGINASVSAGNDGPTASTANAVAPWTPSVAATTHDRFFANALVGLTGGDKEPPGDMSGGSLTAAHGPAPIVIAKGKKNVDGETDNGGCLKAFPAATWKNNEIVVCDRGGNVGRVVKGQNVKAGGAGGLVLVNAGTDGDQINGDAHVLPAVHLGYGGGRALKAWLETGAGHTASITASTYAPRADNGDVMGGFSSRGPAMASQCCRRPGVNIYNPTLFPLVKPDLGAPGVQITAAINRAPNGIGTLDGTSMAAPHVTGAMALLVAAHPNWTPAEIHSALMTTAQIDGVRREDRRYAASPHDVGAGRIDVSRAARAGLLLDVTSADLDATDPGRGGDPRRINLASMADVKCLDRCRWNRVVKASLDRAMTWTVSADAPATMPIRVTPASFTLQPGGTQIVSIEADATKMGRNAWAFGGVVLTPMDPNVPEAHLPVAVHTAVSDVPQYVWIETHDAEGTLKTEGLRVAADSPLVIDVHGLVQGRPHNMSLSQDRTPENRCWGTDKGGCELVMLTVPEGARRVVAQVTSSEAKDIDMIIGIDSNDNRQAEQTEALADSMSDGWNEYAEVAGDLPAGRYWVMVQSFTGSTRQPDDVTLISGVVTAEDVGNLEATAPGSVVAGTPFDLDLRWRLAQPPAPGGLWYGLVDLSTGPGDGAELGRVMVDLIGLAAPMPTPTPTPTGPRPTATATPGPTDPPTPTSPASPTVDPGLPTSPATAPATPDTPLPTPTHGSGETPAPVGAQVYLPRSVRGVE